MKRGNKRKREGREREERKRTYGTEREERERRPREKTYSTLGDSKGSTDRNSLALSVLCCAVLCS